ncbi:MAG: hypothetical protein QXX94_00325 [Candidatus Bathyarchaeia archaeon]
MGGEGKIAPKNFILRVTKEEWFKQVFTIKKYYPGIIRRWEENSLIFLARRSDRGDSFVGYGIVNKFVKRDLLQDEERHECERMGWKGAILFSELYRFEPPLPIKETVLGGLKARGRCWHGYPLTNRQAYEILETASNLCEIRKV